METRMAESQVHPRWRRIRSTRYWILILLHRAQSICQFATVWKLAVTGGSGPKHWAHEVLISHVTRRITERSVLASSSSSRYFRKSYVNSFGRLVDYWSQKCIMQLFVKLRKGVKKQFCRGCLCCHVVVVPVPHKATWKTGLGVSIYPSAPFYTNFGETVYPKLASKYWPIIILARWVERRLPAASYCSILHPPASSILTSHHFPNTSISWIQISQTSARKWLSGECLCNSFNPQTLCCNGEWKLTEVKLLLVLDLTTTS